MFQLNTRILLYVEKLLKKLMVLSLRIKKNSIKSIIH